MDLEKTRTRLHRISGLNGWSIAVVAGLATVISVVSLSLKGTLVGIGITGAGFCEVWGCKFLDNDLDEARKWLLFSQFLFFIVIVTYSVYQLAVFDAAHPLSMFSSDFRESLLALVGPDQELLNQLMTKIYRTTYTAIIILSFLYQGILFWYYNRSTKRLMQETPGFQVKARHSSF